MRLAVITLFLVLTVADCQFCKDPQRKGIISLSALSKQDHLTKVFGNITQGLEKFNSTFNNGTTTFNIVNLTAQLYYNDNEQTESIIDDNTINVTAGKLHMAFQFNYSVGQQKGVASGRASADSFYFLKKLRLYQGYLEWNPVSPIPNITVNSFMSILSSSPTLPYDAKQQFEDMLNSNDPTHNHSSIKTPLVQSINTLYSSDLTYYLNSQLILNSSTLNYTYKGNNCTFTSLVENFTLSSKSGLTYKMIFEIDKYQQKCDLLPDNYSSSYGGVQEYVGLDVWASAVRYALQKGWLDAELDKSWDTEMFQFYAGDVANFIQKASTLKPDTPVKASCKWNSSQFDLILSKYSDKSLYANIPYFCSLLTDTVKLQSMYLTLNFEINIILHNDYIETNVTNLGAIKPTFYSQGEFIVTDKELGNRYAVAVARGIVGGKAFGSGFPAINRKYPVVYIEHDYTIFYDASEK